MAAMTLDSLFLDTLKDVYFAEHEILKNLPKMSQAAKNDRLKQAFDQHRDVLGGGGATAGISLPISLSS